MRVERQAEELNPESSLWPRWTWARIAVAYGWLAATFLHLAWHSFAGGFMTAFWPDQDDLNYAAVEIVIGFVPLLLALIGIGVARRRRVWLVSAVIVAATGIWFVTDVLTSYAHPADELPPITIFDTWSNSEFIMTVAVVVGSVLGLGMIIVRSRLTNRQA
jgi:hypothetical protein